MEIDKQNNVEQNGRGTDEDQGEEARAANNNVMEPSQVINDRPKHKAKRHVRRSPSKEEVVVAVNGTGSIPPRVKNMRRPRNGFGRGLPKKGGAGGKGVWGVAGMVYEEDNVDPSDPNYDSDNQGGYVVQTIVPEMDQKEVEKNVEPIIQEYFEHGDTEEVMDCLKDLNLDSQVHCVPRLAVALSLEKKATQREMISLLISDLYGKKVVGNQEMSQAFDTLLSDLGDLSLDTPDAANVLGCFIARAVADDILPPKYVSDLMKQTECGQAREALDRADILLSVKHGLVRLDNVWGIGGGRRPVKFLIKQMVLLLKEYLSSGDVNEAIQCLRELEVPHFHHELVYEAIVMAIEDSGTRSLNMMVRLLKELYQATYVTLDQLTRGFERVFEAMPDLSLDVPYAYNVLEQFADLCMREHLINEKLRNRVPNRGRKRFVSEGDGGKVKE